MSRNCGVLVEFGYKDSQRTSGLKDRIHLIPKFPVTPNRFPHSYKSRDFILSHSFHLSVKHTRSKVLAD
jgi:hypothetical protein